MNIVEGLKRQGVERKISAPLQRFNTLTDYEL
jgi:hypothetical protein